MICLKSQISSSHLYLLLSEREGAKKSLFATRVVNLCSGKPDLPVKMFLPLVPVKKYFTGKKIWSKKCLFASIFGTFLLEWMGLTFGS